MDETKEIKDILETINSHFTDYLNKNGYSSDAPFMCIIPGHAGDSPSMSYDSSRNRVYCTACKRSLSLIDFYRLSKGLSFAVSFKELAELYCPDYELNNSEIYDGYFRNCKEYLKYNHQFLDEFGLDYFSLNSDLYANLGRDFAYPDKDGNTRDILIIPTGPDSFWATDTFEFDKSIGRPAVSVVYSELVNTSFPEAEAVFLVKNDLDAMTVIAHGAKACAYRNETSLFQFLNKEKKVAHPIVIAISDNFIAETIANECARLRIEYFRIDSFNGFSSLNALSQADKHGFEELIKNWSHPRNYTYRLKTATGFHVGLFEEYVESMAHTKPLSTGWSEVDEMLGGGLMPFLYVLGGRTGSGKTAVALSIADSIAKQGRDVLYVSLEVSEYEIIARSVSRIAFELNGKVWRDPIKPLSEIGVYYGPKRLGYDQDTIDMIHRAEAVYSGYAQHFSVIESVADTTITDVEEQVKEHVRCTGSAPVLIIDYVQALKKADPRMSDRENIDRNIHSLKALSRDYKIPVICLTSFNRDSNSKMSASESAASGSGQIEYTADYLMSWQPEPTELSYEEWRKSVIGKDRNMELFLLKNRHGDGYKSIPCVYNARYSYIFVNKDRLKEVNAVKGEVIDASEEMLG